MSHRQDVFVPNVYMYVYFDLLGNVNVLSGNCT